MLIPVKCFTCGKVIGNKYLIYEEKVKQLQKKSETYLDTEKIEKTPEGKLLDELGLVDICCRRHILTHVDIL